MSISLEDVFLTVWRQSLLENEKTVTLEDASFPVRSTAKRKLKQIDFQLFCIQERDSRLSSKFIPRVRWQAFLRKIRRTSVHRCKFRDMAHQERVTVEDTMSIINRTHSRGVIGHVLHTLVWCALLTSFAYGQAQQSQPEKLAYGADMANVPDAIAKLKSGEFSAVHVDLITRAGAVEAIPILKQQFVRAQDPFLQAKIAAALVRLGDKDDTYWDFLVEFAAPALESDAPDFMNHDSQGKSLPGPSPEFEAWVKHRNLDPGSAGADAAYLLPGKVIALGWSRDPRAIPLLRRALLSPNYQIEIMAAMGLAEIGDNGSVPLIIEACKKAPAEAAAAIAESLIYFDDNAAQSAADQYIPQDRAKIYRDAKAHGKKTPWTVN